MTVNLVSLGILVEHELGVVEDATHYEPISDAVGLATDAAAVHAEVAGSLRLEIAVLLAENQVVL